MTPYTRLLYLARQQAAALEGGDVALAIQLLADRHAILAANPPATDADQDSIRETLQLDRSFAGILRREMARLQAEAAGAQRAAQQLRSYHSARPPSGRMVDVTR